MRRLPLRWLEPASLDLIEIIEFIGSDRPLAARKLGREILHAASGLRAHPRVGKIVPELQQQGISDYRQILVSAYRLVYAIMESSIDIVAVVDARRDFHSTLIQRLMR